MDKQTIKNIIVEWQSQVAEYHVVRREMTFGDTANYVLVGLRRAGKSYLLYQDIQQRIEAGKAAAEDILFVNFEDERLAGLRAEDLGVLLDAYAELYGARRPLVYLDEIQVVEGWEKFARRLADSQYRVMVTGSNARMLSREMATTLGGRFIPREVFPFSFKEYLTYCGTRLTPGWEYHPKTRAAVARMFEEYLRVGGIAETFRQPDKREYLNALYQKILLGDIVERNRVRNPRMFRLLARKLAASVMQPLSMTRIQHIIKSTGDSVSASALKDYLEYMEEAYLIFSIPNLVSPISEQVTMRKRYIADNGLLSIFLHDGETKLLENLVAVALNRKYRNAEEPRLFYYNRRAEIDFCVPEDGLAIQVTFSLSDPATYEREVGGLLSFLKAFPDYKGIVITRDSEQTIGAEDLTIEVVPVWKWLLRE